MAQRVKKQEFLEEVKRELEAQTNASISLKKADMYASAIFSALKTCLRKEEASFLSYEGCKWKKRMLSPRTYTLPLDRNRKIEVPARIGYSFKLSPDVTEDNVE